MKVVDTREYVSMLRELTEEGKEVSMIIAGNSMSPFLIHERDSICFKKPDRKLKKGDMVFYQRPNGQYIMHRICRVKPEGYYIVGDAQQEIEGPVSEEQIFAVITRVNRKGKWIGPGDFWWEFFEHVWVNIVPIRRFAVRLYGYVYRNRKNV
ncbi:S24/S26 family peptidase [Bariatricus sp. SGI.154]|uniref:S24/S26 family peptidase n=1 Tax=Bariatricus sp. SGI.154 TaxID=3420549 RepID=UPI003D02973C